MRVFGLSDGRGGVHHYRIREPLRGLQKLGHETATAPNLGDFGVPDVLLVRAMHGKEDSFFWRQLKGKGVLLVYDLDDDIWAWHPSTESYHLWNDERRLQAELNIQTADLVTTPSEELAKILKQLNKNVVVLPNTIPYRLTTLPSYHVSPRFIIGWQGADQHIPDLDIIYNPVLKFMMKHTDVEFHLWGPRSFIELPKGITERVVCHPWQSSVWAYYYSLGMDVGLAPLKPELHFNVTKSDVRVREYGALGIPCIASDGPAYAKSVISGYNGFIARHEGDWTEALETLYQYAGERARMGARARHRAEKHWTTEGNAALRERAYEDGRRRAGYEEQRAG
jgi:glycosyltransferase involved in cell wall biosynthesis